MCPICTVGVAVCLGLSRWLKVDDAISGLWIGAFILALTFLTNNWLFRKKEKKPLLALIFILILYLVLTFLPLYQAKIITAYSKTILGINNLIFGVSLGIVLTTIMLLIERLIRKKREGKVLFPYQKVVLPILPLLLASFIIYFTICK